MTRPGDLIRDGALSGIYVGTTEAGTRWIVWRRPGESLSAWEGRYRNCRDWFGKTHGYEGEEWTLLRGIGFAILATALLLLAIYGVLLF